MNIGILYSRIRKDEKLLLSELRARGHTVTKIDVRQVQFTLSDPPKILEGLDIVVDRCLATSRSLYALRFLEAYGIPVINDTRTAELCADKVKNSLALAQASVPVPETEVAFTTDSALESIERFGYPVVIKPVVGSWGRLMAKIESRTAAEAILEHKEVLGHYEHKVFYIQDYVEKPGRDIRVVTLDGEPLAGMTRSSDHWLTNAARGATTEPFDVEEEVDELARQASAAVGGGFLGVDLMETGGSYVVHEVNHTVEFKALAETTGVDVAGAVIDWAEERARTTPQATA